MFVTGDPEWTSTPIGSACPAAAPDETLGLRLPLSHQSPLLHAGADAGGTAKLVVRLPIEKTFRIAEWRELAKIPFKYDTTSLLHAGGAERRREDHGVHRRQGGDGRDRLGDPEGQDRRGRERARPLPEVPRDGARACGGAIDQRIAARESDLAKLRAGNPKPKLWKKFSVKGFGARAATSASAISTATASSTC